MNQLTFEDFAAQCLWYEHQRLSRYISDFERQKHFKKLLHRIKRGDLSLLPPTNDWARMVAQWYQKTYPVREGAD